MGAVRSDKLRGDWRLFVETRIRELVKADSKEASKSLRRLQSSPQRLQKFKAKLVELNNPVTEIKGFLSTQTSLFRRMLSHRSDVAMPTIGLRQSSFPLKAPPLRASHPS